MFHISVEQPNSLMNPKEKVEGQIVAEFPILCFSQKKTHIYLKFLKWSQSWISSRFIYCQAEWSGYLWREDGAREREREKDWWTFAVFKGRTSGRCDSTLGNNHRMGSRIDGLTWTNISKAPETWTHWPTFNEAVLRGICAIIDYDWASFGWSN